MQTFPQIFLKNKDSSQIKIGGNSDLNELINIINDAKKNNKFDKMINTIKNKFSIDKKTSLKLVKIFI